MTGRGLGPEPTRTGQAHPQPVSDGVSSGLFFAVAFLIVTVLTVLLYGVLAGLVSPPAPRTRSEAVSATMEARVKEQPGDGKAWADYAEALYASGDKTKAFEVVASARKVVKDESLNAVNAAEVHLMLLEGRDADVIARSKTYIQKALDLRTAKYEENAAKGTVVPFIEMDNRALISLFTFRATAEENLKDYKAAIRDYTNALAANPQAADIQVMRGWARLRAGDTKGAKSDFEAALKFLPGDSSATSGLRAVAATEAARP